MKHIKLFTTENNYNNWLYSDKFVTPYISKNKYNNSIIYQPRIKYNCPYQRVEYLQPINNAYITINNLGIYKNDFNNASYIEYTTDCIMYDNGAEGINSVYFFIGASSNYFYSGCGTTWNTTTTLNDYNRHIIKLIKNSDNYVYYYIDNVMIDNYVFNNTIHDILSFNLFNCLNFVGPHLNKQKKYYSKLQINDNVLFEVLPVKLNNVGYMYDTVTKQLFGSANNDTFIFGKNI